jgi:hypothetical protein
MGVLQQLAQEADPVGQRAAIFVGPVVVAAQQEVHGQGQLVGGVAVDDVVAGLFGPQGGVAVPAADFADIGFVQRPALAGGVVAQAAGAQAGRRYPGGEVGGVVAAVGQLDAGQGPVLVNGLDHELMGGQVVVTPQAALDVRHQVASVVDLDLFGADHAPAAFGFHAAHGGQGPGHAVAEAVAVRHLVEAVGGRHRAYGDGFEEDGEGIGHGVCSLRSQVSGKDLASKGYLVGCPHVFGRPADEQFEGVLVDVG